MTDVVQTPEQWQEDINAWGRSKLVLDKAKATEMALRKKLAAHFFPTPKEGTNYAPSPMAGWKFKMVQPITRDIDQDALVALSAALKEEGCDLEELIVYKPSLAIKPYRALDTANPELRAKFDAVLTIKAGSPALTVEVDK